MDCSKEDLIMNDYIAYCGLDCEACEARLATINNDNELRIKVSKEWSELCGYSGRTFHKDRKGD